jgi:hypothetical protein
MTDMNKPHGGKHPHTRTQAGSVRATTDASPHKGAGAVQQGGRSSTDAPRQRAEVTADARPRDGEAGAEAVRRAGSAPSDTLRRGAQPVAESQPRMAQDAARKFEEASRKIAGAAKGTTGDESRLMAMPNAAEGGLRDLQQNMAGLVEGVVRTNLRMAQELFRQNDPASVAELQQRFLREYTEALLQGSAALAQAVRRIADDAPCPREEKLHPQTAAE